MFGLPWDQTLAASTFVGMIVFLFLGFPVAFSLTFTGLVFGLVGFEIGRASCRERVYVLV